MKIIDKTLINKLTELANKEKKIKEFKKRLRVKGKVVAKGTTKKGNITLTLKNKIEERILFFLKALEVQVNSSLQLIQELELYKKYLKEAKAVFKNTILAEDFMDIVE